MGTLIDSNVLLDIATADPKWLSWSSQQIQHAVTNGPVLINPIIYAEIAPAFKSQQELDRWLAPSIFQRLPLPYEAGFRAAQAFVRYRRQHGSKTTPLPDFYIGAHAEVENHILITRDTTRYRTYFPSITLICP